MDRTAVIATILCVAAYFFLTYEMERLYPTVHRPLAATATHSSSPTNSAEAAPSTITSLPATEPASAFPASKPAVSPVVSEKLNYLENANIKVTFTTEGAAIKSIDLKKQKNGSDGDVVLNEKSHASIMEISGWPGADTSAFSVASARTPNTMAYTTILANGVSFSRQYELGPEFGLTVNDSLSNRGSAEVVLPAYSISLGQAQPLRVSGHYQPISNQYVGAGWLTTEKYHLTTIGDFNPSGMFTRRPARDLISSSVIDKNPLRWLAVEDQFFAVLLTPGADRQIPEALFRCYNQRDPNGYLGSQTEPEIEAAARFPEVHIPAGGTVNLSYNLYTGPKEYTRLNVLGQNQGELMNYDGVLPFSMIIVPMLSVLHFFYRAIGNYGVAIILLTLCVKGLTWPLQSFANRSGKRMQALAPMVKELQAKYKDQPEKLNTETFAMYRKFGVNPIGGCLPALVQMPVFFSLYFMLQNAVELRGQSFLWVHDLTQPDTILSATLPFVLPILNTSHLVLNPLPLMMTSLTMVMMKMTPQIGDPQQAKIAQIMPLFLLFFLYNFAAGLALYYVVNNCVSILQIYRNLRKPLPDLKAKTVAVKA